MHEHECRGGDARGLCALLPVAALLALVGLKMGKKHHEGCGEGKCAHCAHCAGCARHHAQHGHGDHGHAGNHDETSEHHEHGPGREFRDFGPGPMRRRMDPLRILDKRYAAGEIDEEDYLRRRQVLKDNS